MDIANDLGDQRVIAILKSNGAKAEQKSLLSIGITALIEFSNFTITLFMADLWLYNATDRKWEYINPSCTTCDANGVEADGTGELDLDGPRGRIKASMITYQDSLYVFGGYAYGGDSNFQQLYPVPSECTGSGDTCLPREQFYASLETKFFLNDLWRYDILLKSWTELKSPEADRKSVV